jgi:hypothetical protein
MPSTEPPSARSTASAETAPAAQSGKNAPQTRSPTLNRSTPGPTATISPAPSDSGMTFGFAALG